MLDRTDRQTLMRWCRSRHVKCVSGDAKDEAMLLRPDTGPATRLYTAGDEWTLATEAGETLAAASDLPALLDAIDAGIYEAAR